MITYNVRTNPEVSYIRTNHNVTSAHGLEIYEGDDRVFIEGMDRQGNTMDVGLTLDPITMDALCLGWAMARGYVVATARGNNICRLTKRNIPSLIA